MKKKNDNLPDLNDKGVKKFNAVFFFPFSTCRYFVQKLQFCCMCNSFILQTTTSTCN